MKNLVSTLLFLAAGVAAAQAAGPLVVDGKQVQGAVITVDGKQYISIDALKSAGANINPQGLFLYTVPGTTNPPIKLKACQNEWAYDGVLRMRVVKVDNPGTSNTTEKRLDLEVQTSEASFNIQDYIYEKGQITAQTNLGGIFNPAQNSFQQLVIYNGSGYAARGSAYKSSYRLDNPDLNLANEERYTRIIVQGDPKRSKGPITFDLTCQQ